jgi:hypothetical protein
MALKKIYNKINCFNIFERKINALVLYNKQYIRNKLVSNIKLINKGYYKKINKINYISILDNNSFLFYGRGYKNILLGYDFFGENSFFYHKKLTSISFVAIQTFRVPNLKNISIKLISLINIAIKKYTYKIPLLILCPIKGGFKAYYLGIFGFIPFKHGMFGITKFVIKFFRKEYTLLGNHNLYSIDKFLFFYSTNNINLFLNIYKIFFKISAIKLVYNFRYRFKSRRRFNYKNKNKLLRKKINFVFITENKKLYKNLFKKSYKKFYKNYL